jgi:hypothetical protein
LKYQPIETEHLPNFPAVLIPTLFLLTLLALLLPATLFAQNSPTPDPLYQKLTSASHRLAGSPQGIQAGDAILDSLQSQGIPHDWITIQPFPVTQLKIGPNGCLAQTPSGAIPLSPLRPNLLIPPAIPSPGLTAQIIDVGNCHWAHLSTLPSLQGKIALIGPDAGPQWRRAIDLGAVALIFEQSNLQPVAEPWLNANIDIPRFSLLPQHAQTLRRLSNTQPITLISDIQYTTSLARNIFINIPAHPDSKRPKSESVLFLTPYDSYGAAPFHAPALQQAANAAALVQSALFLKSNPPSRPITLAFIDNNAQAQSGQLYLQWARLIGPAVIEQLVNERRRDREWTSNLLLTLSDAASAIKTSQATPFQEYAHKFLTDQAEWENSLLIAELSQARIELLALTRQSQNQETPAVVKLRAHVYALESQHENLSKARRLLALGHLSDNPAENTLLHQMVDHARQRFTRRLAELDVQLQWLPQSQALAAQLANTRTVMAVYFNLPARDWPATISTPTPGITGFVINQQAKNTLAGLAAKQPAHISSDILETSPAYTPWSVTARTTWAIEIGQASTDLPSPDPVSPNFPARFSSALSLALALCESPDLSQVRTPGRSSNLVFNTPRIPEPGRSSGCLVRYYDDQTKLGRPAPGAVVAIRSGRTASEIPDPPDRSSITLSTSDETGAFWLMASVPDNTAVNCHAITFDASGSIQRTSQFNPVGDRGTTSAWESASWYIARDPIQLPIFLVRHTGLVSGLQSITGPIPANLTTLIDARSQSTLNEQSATSDSGILQLYAGKTKNFKLLAPPLRLINSQPQEQNPLGAGYPISSGKTLDALALGAQDLWNLNESRLDRLRRNGIDLPWVERQHAAAQALMENSAQSPSHTPSAQEHAEKTLSIAYSNRVYQPVRDVTNDLIKSVVVLLLLAVPFAYALERLVVGSANVYGQIIAFSVIFSSTFALLYWVHPAFRFAGYPLIVLLAFLIIVMSALVIWIMWAKFEYEMRRLHGVATQSHQSTRDARATVAAAISQGIATMKRRPLKTLLTLLTIAILTFTVLFFGAFSSEPAVQWITLGVNPGQPEISARPTPTAPWPSQTVDTFAARWSGQAQVYRRAWAVAPAGSYITGRAPDSAGGAPFKYRAWVILPRQDIDRLPALAQSLTGDIDGFKAHGGILLPKGAPIPPSMIGQPCLLQGVPQIFRGYFDPALLSAVRTTDGAPILALDTIEMRRKIEQEITRDPETVNQRMAQLDAAEYPTIDAADTLLISDSSPLAPRNNVQTLVILPTRHVSPTQNAAPSSLSSANPQPESRTPQPSTHPKAIAAELTLILDRPVFLVADSLAQRAVFSSKIQLGGITAIAVPLLLGSLLVFSSMMSSVADREREIFTFSALGLAPRHIALLFFAEAAVYGLVGALSGYLGAQIFAKAAGLLSRLNVIDAPALNYSSTNAVLTLLVVIAAVLVSTIYPAFKASRSANPGIQRSWKMPTATGDTLHFEFPFTVSHDDMTGLVSYLHEYFSQHKDRSIGGFAAAQAAMSQSDNGFTLSAQVWLQPFDQGVCQSFLLTTEPSDIPGIDRVLLTLTRSSGNPAMWTRANKLFIALLREQFLLWRTLPDDTIEHYHALTTARLNLTHSAPSDPSARTNSGVAHAS